MIAKLLLTFLIAALSACAPYQGSLRERGTAAASRGAWEEAYRFSEDALMSDDSGKRLEAREFVLNNRKIYEAAGQTFRSVALEEAIQKYGETTAYSIEENRLQAYKTVASEQDYDAALSTFNRIFDEARKKKEARIREAEQADVARKTEQMRRASELFQLEKSARIICRNEMECKKVFALTEIFAAEQSDMKIQLSTGNLIETYNPTKSYNVGLKAVKTPLKGESAEVSLRVVCAGDAREEYCEKRKISIYGIYPEFIKNKLFN